MNLAAQALQREEYALYSRLIYPTCQRLLANGGEAEEAMHDALLLYFSFTGHFDSEAQKRSWLFKVAISKSIDRLRRMQRKLFGEEAIDMDKIEEDDEFLGEEDSQIQGIDLAEKVCKVKGALAQLSPGYRTVLSLFLFEGYDFEEISEILSITPATVRSQYARGRRNLRELLATPPAMSK